jgi:hypothetical protein
MARPRQAGLSGRRPRLAFREFLTFLNIILLAAENPVFEIIPVESLSLGVEVAEAFKVIRLWLYLDRFGFSKYIGE